MNIYRMGYEIEFTFTSLRELKDLLNQLPDEDLDALTNECDWFSGYIMDGHNDRRYFHIEPKDGGEE